MGNVNGLYNIILRLKVTKISASSTDFLVMKKKSVQYFKCWTKCFVTEISYKEKIGGGMFPV